MDRSVGNFIIRETGIDGVRIIDMKKHGDQRGFFMETYRHDLFTAAGLSCDFVQDNHSCSGKGVLRGLHYQKMHPQTKLVRVIRGEVFDVAVDLRKGSPTFGKSVCVCLSGENNRQLYIPRGFAHGFMVMSDSAEVVYKCDDYYHPEDEGGIAWNDPALAIRWPDNCPILSERDRHHPALQDCGFAYDRMVGR